MNNPALDPASDPAALSVEDIAQVCHEANRAFCKSHGDFSQRSWANAADWQKDSAVKGVVFNLENPDAPASASRDSWLANKLAFGWKWGPVRNPETGEHPCIVPYAELPAEQQAKDHLFKAVVSALAPFLPVAFLPNGLRVAKDPAMDWNCPRVSDGPDWAKDAVYVNTTIRFDWRARLRILMGKPVELSTRTCTQMPAGKLETDRVTVHIAPLFERLFERRKPSICFEAAMDSDIDADKDADTL